MATSLKSQQWKQVWIDLIAGIERELSSIKASGPRKELRLFVERLKRPILKRDREKFEDDLESFIESDKALEAAAWRHLNKSSSSAIKEAETLIKAAEKYLREKKQRFDLPQVNPPKR